MIFLENIFSEGFTERSFLNILKVNAEVLYKKAINAKSNTNKKYNTKGLKFTYIQDDTLNACVWIEDDYDNMCINTGTLVILYSLFYTAFSDRSMFPNIGKVDNESNNLVKGCFDSSKIQLLFTDQPKDEDRLTIANLTAMFACNYIYAHELGHLLNGHGYLLKTLYGNNRMEMILKNIMGTFSNTKKEEYSLDRRTLEMDADSFAATFGINNIIGLYQEREKNKIYFDLLESPFQIFELWTFAVHNIFMIFELACPSRYKKTDTYLPNEAREILNLLSADKTIDSMIERGYFKCTDWEKSEIKKHFFKGIKEAEKFFNNLFGKKYNFIEEGLKKPEYNEYVNEVLNNWDNKLRYKLKKYSRAILYDPNGMDY